jgi:hypothetical protein
MLQNLTREAVPEVTAETLRVIEEQGINASKLTLPKETKVQDAIRRVINRPSATYASSKRGPLDPADVEAIVGGYRQNFGKGGRVRHMTDKYIVLDPA